MIHHSVEFGGISTKEVLELITDLLVTIGSCEIFGGQFSLPRINSFLTLLLERVDSLFLDVTLSTVQITEFGSLIGSRALLLVDSILLSSVLLLEVIHQRSFLVGEVFVYIGGNFVDFILQFVLVELLLGSLSALKSLFKSPIELLLLSASIVCELGVNSHDGVFVGLQQTGTVFFGKVTLELDSLDDLVSLRLGVTTVVDGVGNISLGAIDSTQFSS